MGREMICITTCFPACRRKRETDFGFSGWIANGLQRLKPLHCENAGGIAKAMPDTNPFAMRSGRVTQLRPDASGPSDSQGLSLHEFSFPP
jgi:hypothetical protein